MPGVYVKAIEIGNGILDSLFWPMDDQVIIIGRLHAPT
jgi:hypothetical protein